ncbi:HalOD1 output domain-containing protein [Haloglomus litoreum]|uniref:HalOD1 output domain-containing protein n=1 Tax=Haloglomus litoreum TaxID=3034026 RepID=UPI0023E7B49B|nr:HalOD1 output domain-containing protein [Haloglomus sp. DT116]
MPREGGVAENIVLKIADREGVNEGALPPLFESVEPDALDELFNHETKIGGTDLKVEFSYSGYTVVIRGADDIIVE